MMPAVPPPRSAKIKTPIELKLKPGWRFDPKRRVFVSDRGQVFKPQVPRSSRIVYKVPRLAKAPSASLSLPERDLQRYMQVILPAGEPPRAHVDAIATWPFVEEAHVAPEVSLPGSIPSPAPLR
jgi:hypothetical protein